MIARPFAPAILGAVLFLAPCIAGADGKPADAPKLSVRTDRPEALYKLGETVTFQIEFTGQHGPADDAEVTWTLSKDGVPPLTTGKLKLSGGKAVVTGKLDEPGFLQCRASCLAAPGLPALTAVAGAGIDPLQIKPSLPAPDDFDAFWSEQKRKLAVVPVNPRITPVPQTAGKEVNAFDVQLDCLGSTPVSGYFAKPATAKPKSLPVILLVHGAGVGSSTLASAMSWAKNGLLAMDINAHGIPNGKPEGYYKDLTQGALNNYRTSGRESRDTCYFLFMFLRELRAIDFLCAQPEWDGKNVVVYGSSQGGFQAFAAAGLDDRVTFFAAGVPAGCDHTGAAVGRINGWPKLVPLGADGKPDPAVATAARYFDNVNFASRTRAKGCIVTVGFIDTTCPPTSVYAAYNNLTIPKKIHHDPLSGHTNTPQASAAMMGAVLGFLKPVKAQP